MQIVGATNMSVDCSDAFNTTEVFPSRDVMLNWARDVAKENGFVLIILRSETSTKSTRTTRRNQRKTFVILGCDRSGKYRGPYKNALSRKVNGTRKCECPFRLRGKALKKAEGWIVKVMCGCHNHELEETLVGHPYAGRLSAEEKSLVDDMTKNMMKPKDILLTLKDYNMDNVTTIKQIYNARQAYRSSQKGLEMQYLLKLLEREQYVYWYRKVDDSNVIRDMFWTHPDAIKLLGAFNTVLIIDSIYTTTRYPLPLLEIVGVTSTELTFSVAFAFVESERADNFTWALQKLRGLIVKDEDIPQVIVTNRDISLMNAVQVVFPSSSNLLCRFHINNNVKTKCLSIVHPKEKQDLVMDAWDVVVNSSNESEYMQRLALFEKVCSAFPNFGEYVKNMWLIPYKEKFVASWTNQVMHLGNTTTIRVEATNCKLKNLLQDSKEDMCSYWDAMNDMITLQLAEIKWSFEKSINVVDHMHNNTSLYINLQGLVSRSALSHITDEYDRVKAVGTDSSKCCCIVRTTHGLPCACELARYSTMCHPIPLEAIHVHWKKLNFDRGMNDKESELSLQPELDALLKRFQELDCAGKIILKAKLYELAFPDTISKCPTPTVVRIKGAPGSKRDRSIHSDLSHREHVDAMRPVHSGTSSCPSSHQLVHESKRRRVLSMMDQFPIQIHPFIEEIIDVKADSNCGYRAVAAQLGMGEESWALVRQDLIRELQQWQDMYAKLFGSNDRVAELRQSLYVDKETSIKKWMTIPDMGYVIASRYNVVLVALSLKESMTFFPLRGRPPLSQSRHRLIAIGLVHDCHFVQVALKAGSAIPPTALQWSRYCSAESRSWETSYVNRMEHFRSLFPQKKMIM
ncbi:PKS-NRPS hybrid synthetase CHGG_01239-like isoform X1 [Vigna unguiculata]|uniref:PKS-NRPS hybrid synthetase CHGG_01239-like isoform X1 n=2 Tax=Vigna unguiculata TaxID=3917 RepID=UPI001016E2AA|nr:PKS-NRPS hybrid synthetase CHGG_01239-like isoform X1 [Vigna unguiculata]XP_027913071.1 PKS-NRPS hybrid synthetase CHGG_01239-like isoform X1 [Vigna unguiculata]XP_027913072.1 PKS-NRPS hybrid synthetase CHGG_01239-like isoform X1 [Vigna unguiculata]XP_027913073.1 PKS-NRPS hybrid synthetase CHGG_01239-like isoform X1 [Vigna unguiculata]XP_027913074.1 PKS-NRPS hybrid synthetase CHGG_01239-like isoform X1 [Vigna unguiculata]XP_027913075.1 PKS-NRPS hybrid synthetase CHGG_01239-like isoform X1 [